MQSGWFSFDVSDSQMKHVANPKRQYCANVVLKVNAKLGGANVYLPPRHMPFVSERPTVRYFHLVTDNRSSWVQMSIIPPLEIVYDLHSVLSLLAWIPVHVVTLLHCVHKVLELRSSQILKP